MFDNILFQSTVIDQIKRDITRAAFPQAALFFGEKNCGKFTTALEVARVLGCEGEGGGEIAGWNCSCPSCKRARLLASSNLLILGGKDLTFEIKAAAQTLIRSLSGGSRLIKPAKFLFIRAVKKLSIRFSSFLYEEDKNISKITSVALDLQEALDVISKIDPMDPNLDDKEIEKNVDKILILSATLGGFLPKATPVDHIRGVLTFARLKTEGTKVIIIEGADRMTPSAGNALLKILEEPPNRCVFILTTEAKNAILTTILSRVRVYQFRKRTEKEDSEIISRIFRVDYEGSIEEYLSTFCGVKKDVIKKAALDFFSMMAGEGVALDSILKACNNFSSEDVIKTFFLELLNLSHKTNGDPEEGLKARRVSRAVEESYSDITTFNESPRAALEGLLCTNI